MLERTFDIEHITRVLTDPSVIDHVNLGMEMPDVTEFVQNDMNVCLFNEHGGFLCFQFVPGWFDIHTAFLPEGRGRKAVEAAAWAAQKLFTDYGAKCLVTFVPDNNRAAYQLARLTGFSDDYQSEVFGVSGMTMKMEKPTCQ